jgi:hypothetical protein
LKSIDSIIGTYNPFGRFLNIDLKLFNSAQYRNEEKEKARTREMKEKEGTKGKRGRKRKGKRKGKEGLLAMTSSFHRFEISTINTFSVPSKFEKNPFHEVFDPSRFASNVDGRDLLLGGFNEPLTYDHFSVQCCRTYELCLQCSKL